MFGTRRERHLHLGRQKLNTGVPVFRSANSRQPFSRTPESSGHFGLSGSAQGSSSTIEKRMSFSTVQLDALGSIASSWMRNIITTGVRYVQSCSQRVVPVLQRCASWRHPSRSAVQTQCTHRLLASAMLRAAWVGLYVQDDIQGNKPSLTLIWVFAGLLRKRKQP